MQAQARKRTNPKARDVYPILLRGYKRLWGISGNNYKTTFLTLIKSKKSFLNAVYYPADLNDIVNVDQREYVYCRQEVPEDQIEPLLHRALPKGVYWVYVQKNNKIEKPSEYYPIAQSYVDIFIDGCMQVSNTYQIPNFVDLCIDKTDGWPSSNDGSWVNDRIYPRYPFAIPGFNKNIDILLAKHFKNYYDHPFD